MWSDKEQGDEQERLVRGQPVAFETKQFFELLIESLDRKSRLSQFDRDLKDKIVAFLDVHRDD